MRYFAFLATAALLVPASHAREQEDFHEKAKLAAQRTVKDVQTLVGAGKLDGQQREKFDAGVKDLVEFLDAASKNQWDGERERLERAIDEIEFVVKNAKIGDQERTTLEIDLYTLRDVRDGWK